MFNTNICIYIYCIYIYICYVLIYEKYNGDMVWEYPDIPYTSIYHYIYNNI